MEREDEIKLIAYNIWEEEGCSDGHDCEHWLRAEAIWELKQKDAAKSTQLKANQPVKQNNRVMPTKKKSHKP